MSEPAVEIRHVAKRYDKHVAIRDLSLVVPVGAVYGLLGPNGAGKTTTIRMILNIIAPDEGTIEVLGQPNATSGLLDRVGYLPEERGLYKKMQVRRLLRFLAALKGVSAKDADRRIDVWMERFALSNSAKDWGQAKVDELSRGMQQKVQFIAAMLHEPELVILDEPFSGLDPINAQAMKDTVVDLKREGREGARRPDRGRARRARRHSRGAVVRRSVRERRRRRAERLPPRRAARRPEPLPRDRD